MKFDSFRLSILITICVVIIVLIIITIIILIKKYTKKSSSKNEKKENFDNSQSPTSAQSQHISIIPPSQNENTTNTIIKLKKDILSKENKINAFCDCFLKPVKYSLIKIYNESCPIDLVPFNQKDEISVTKCLHGFHFNCIKKYLLENEKNNEFKCPICLTVLFDTDIKI